MASEVSYLRNQNALTLKALICVLCAFKILLSDSVNKYSRNLLVKMEMKSQGYTCLAGFFGGRHLSMCKLQCELVATAALFAHIPVVRAKILFFSFDYGGKLHTEAASTAHSLRYLYTLLYLRGVCVSASRNSSSQSTEREPGSSCQLLSARGINKSARSCSLGSGYWFLHKVMFVLLLV